jgi:capsular exopolysaccharide synthesis family protein
LELRHVLAALWKWKWLIIAATVIGAATSLVVEARGPRLYRATTTLMVGQFLQAANAQVGDLQLGQQLAQSYAQVVRRQPILEGAIQELGLPISPGALAARVSAVPVPQSSFIQISVVDTDPVIARDLANAIARQVIVQSPTPQDREQDEQRQFAAQQLAVLQGQIIDAEIQQRDLDQRLGQETSARAVQEIQSQSAALQSKITSWRNNYTTLLNFYQGGRVNYLSVSERAVNGLPISPPISTTAIAAGLIGLILAAGAAVLIEQLDTTIRPRSPVTETLRLPFLGEIERIDRRSLGDSALVSLAAPSSTPSDSYRLLRTNLQAAQDSGGNPRQLVLTSAVSGEGVTSTACNLAVALARTGMQVILCDANLRQPSVHPFLAEPSDRGLTTLLDDRAVPLNSVLQSTQIETLKLLASGSAVPNPGDYLGSESMRERLHELRQNADIVLFDAPATSSSADAAVLASQVGTALLVIASGRTKAQLVRQAREEIERGGATVIGAVLNDVHERHSRTALKPSTKPRQISSSKATGAASRSPFGVLGGLLRKRPAGVEQVSPQVSPQVRRPS